MNNLELTQVNLAKKSTIKIGGIADKCFFPIDSEQVVQAIKYFDNINLAWYCVGGCSNILFPQSINFGLIFMDNINYINVVKDLVVVGAGTKLGMLVGKLRDMELSGLEWAVGIPASVGGAVYMNAGAYGGQMADVVEYVDYTDGKNIIRLKKDKLFFDYRKSVFTNLKKCAIIDVALKLKHTKKSIITQNIQKCILARVTTQNVKYASLGSVFKRTTGVVPAQLIELAGLKGVRVGDAMISTQHSGFVVNVDRATTQNVLDLIDLVKKVVYQKFKVKLTTEIIIL